MAEKPIIYAPEYPTLYVLVGHDGLGANSDIKSIIAQAKEEGKKVKIIEQDNGLTIEAALQQVKPPAHIFMLVHGVAGIYKDDQGIEKYDEGAGASYFNWRKDEYLAYGRLFRAVPEGVDTVVIGACNAGYVLPRNLPRGTVAMVMVARNFENFSNISASYLREVLNRQPITRQSLALEIYDHMTHQAHGNSARIWDAKVDAALVATSNLFPNENPYKKKLTAMKAAKPAPHDTLIPNPNHFMSHVSIYQGKLYVDMRFEPFFKPDRLLDHTLMQQAVDQVIEAFDLKGRDGWFETTKKDKRAEISAVAERILKKDWPQNKSFKGFFDVVENHNLPVETRRIYQAIETAYMEVSGHMDRLVAEARNGPSAPACPVWDGKGDRLLAFINAINRPETEPSVTVRGFVAPQEPRPGSKAVVDVSTYWPDFAKWVVENQIPRLSYQDAHKVAKDPKHPTYKEILGYLVATTAVKSRFPTIAIGNDDKEVANICVINESKSIVECSAEELGHMKPKTQVKSSEAAVRNQSSPKKGAGK